MPIPSLSAFDPAPFFHLPAIGSNKVGGDGNGRADAQVQGIAISNDLSGRLSVTTAEGDRITLSANLEADFRSVSYQSRVEANGGSVEISAKYAELSMRKEFGMTVDGDLNEQEVRDLAKLFRKVTHIFKRYFSGQNEEALAKTEQLAERFGRFSSLSGLDLSVDVERSVTVVAAQLTASGAPAVSATTPDTETTSSATLGAASSTATAIPPPSSATTAPTQPSASEPSAATAGHAQVAVPPVQEDKTHRSLVDQILDAVRAANVETHKIGKYLPRLLDNVLEDLRKELRGGARVEIKQTDEVPALTAGAAFFSYRSTKQTSITLSIHT